MLENGQSAAKFRKGKSPTTIPREGSTLQAIGSGSGFALTGKAEG